MHYPFGTVMPLCKVTVEVIPYGPPVLPLDLRNQIPFQTSKNPLSFDIGEKSDPVGFNTLNFHYFVSFMLDTTTSKALITPSSE